MKLIFIPFIKSIKNSGSPADTKRLLKAASTNELYHLCKLTRMIVTGEVPIRNKNMRRLEKNTKLLTDLRKLFERTKLPFGQTDRRSILLALNHIKEVLPIIAKNYFDSSIA